MILLRRLEARAFKRLDGVDLAFPARGAVLIEGLNESGKSTLLEAIYFALYGAPLVAEGGPAALATLLPYDGRAASVTLTLAVDDTELEIRRMLTPGKLSISHEARLVVRRPGKASEEVYGARAVSDRVRQELHGLDGAALRNSCFVEQDALDRVEALPRSAREEAIASLLGLERLSAAERELKPTAEEEASLKRARTELALAERWRASRDASAHEAELATTLAAARARGLVAERDELVTRQAEMERQRSEKSARVSDLERRVARAAEVGALLLALDASEADHASAREAEEQVRRLRGQIDELDRVEGEDLPGGQARIEALRQAETDLAALEEARRHTQTLGRQLRLAEMDDRLERLAQLVPAIGAYEVAQRDLASARLAREQAQAEVDAQAALERANADLATAEEHVRASETLMRQANLRDILTYWVRLKEVEQLQSGNEQMAEYAAERDDLAARAELLQRRQFTAAMVVVFCAVLQVIGIAIGFRFLSTNLGFLSWGIALLAFLVMWVFVIFYFVTMYRRRRTDTRLRIAERKLTLSSIRSEAANLIGGAVEDLPTVEDDLRAADMAVPASIEAGREELDRLVAVEPAALSIAQDRVRDAMVSAERARGEAQVAQARLEAARRLRVERSLGPDIALADIERRLDDAEQVATESETAAKDLLVEPFSWPVEQAVAEATSVELTAQRAQVVAELGEMAGSVPDLATAQQALADAKLAEEQRAQTLSPQLAALELPEDAATVAAARGGAEAELARLQERVAQRETLQADLATETARLEEMHGSLSGATRTAMRAAAGLALVGMAAQGASKATETVEPAEAPHPDIAAITQDRDTLRAAATATTQELDERAARDELPSLRAEVAQHDERLAETGAMLDDTTQRIQTSLGEQGVAAQGSESLEALIALWPLLASVTPDDVGRYEQEVEQTRLDAQFARRAAEDLAIQSSYDAEAVEKLDEAACRKRVAEEDRALHQRELAVGMAREVRARIVRRVLPETEARMRSILPALTNGQRQDARLVRLNEDEAAPDLRVEVWDQAAGRYVAKEQFSGGARDQVSLALRLAFALATLPKDSAAAPGFLFLDEPLSAFDEERASGLVSALTHGELARAFPQVFLIAHSRAFDPGAFGCHVRMEEGHVAAASLADG
ncbi:MAG TPA: AAA family ATPase [Ktedonobacterales bacterium]|nr:AAA family ATPase [Ktedonobacterales bacterium]